MLRSFSALFWAFILCLPLYAAPDVDNNAGCWTDNFQDQLGTVVANTSNIDFDVFAGTVSLAAGQASGVQQTVVISPPSFDSWLSVCLDANYSGGSDLTIDVLDAATDAPLSGYTGIPISSFTNGCYDISGIDINTYPELKIQINHTRGNTAPVVNELSVKWSPRTFLLFDKVAPPSVLAGQEFRYKVRVSANFVDAENVVIYDQLPQTANGTVIYETGEDYGQSDDPIVGQISDDGIYTATATTVNGIAIPAHSIYWTFDKIEAGVSKVLQFYVHSPNGTLDGTIWENSAEAFTTNGEDQSALPVQTVILSSPSPQVSKEAETTGNPAANKVYPIQGTNYIIGGDVVTFIVSGSNGYASEGRERMHNSVMWDNLSDLIDNGLIVGAPTNISGGGVFTTTATTVDGVNIPANSIYWSLGTLHPGNSTNQSFQVEIVANPTVQEYTNYVHLDSDQTSEVENDIVVNPVAPDDGSGGGGGLPGGGCNGCKLGYFSSYSSGEQDRNCSGADGGVPLNFGDPLQYRYGYSNCGGGELEEIVFYDMVPAETRFIDASFSDPSGLLTGSIYYYEDLTGTFTDNTMPPTFDWTNPVSGGWTATKPVDTDDPTQTIWVAWHVEGLTSPFVDADPTRPTTANINLDVLPTVTAVDCEQVYVENTALTHVYQFAPQGGGTIQVSPDNTSPLYAASGSDITQLRSPIGQFALSLDNGGITGNLFAPAQVTFSVDVCNENRNSSAPFINTDLTFNYYGLMINGTTMYPNFVDATGGTVTNFDPANGTITMNIGPMVPSDCETATITIFVPEGIIDMESVTIGAEVIGYDPDCDPVTASTARTIPVTAVPIIEVYKDDVLNVIGTGDEIDYEVFYRNIGESPSTNTWVVDRIPFKTTFVDAMGMNGEEVWFTNQLPPNMPANQISVIYPIDFSVISANFSLGIKNDMGTPTDFTDDIWTSPFGDQTTWIAFKVDDPTLSPNQVPVDINFRKTMFTVRNDDDGTGPNTTGSPEGTVIFNEEVIFSDQNLMAVGNEVRTTIEDFPGLVMDKRSSKEVVNTGEAFDWIVDYRNNSVAKNDIVTITDVIPAEFTFNSVSHEWNAAAGGGGVTDITNDPTVTVTNNPDGTTTVEILVAGSPGLRTDLLSDEGGTFYFNVQSKADVPCGALIFNEVTGFSSNVGGDAVTSDEDPVTIYNPDVFINKSVSNLEPKNGDVLTYTLSYGNNSIIEAPGVVIRDTLPAGFTYVANSTSSLSLTTTIGEPTIMGNVLEWSNINVAGHPMGTFPPQYSNNYLTYEVTVSGALGESHTNIAGISTTSPEKDEFPNVDSVTVFLPHPDPTIQKRGPAVSSAGENVVWELTYFNKNNADANEVYIIESLPDANGNGADVSYVSTNTNGPSTVTPYFTSTAGTAPAFDPANPASGTWSASPTSPVNHIAYLVGTLPAKDGPYTIQVTAALIDAVDGSLPAPGTQFLNRTEIFTSSIDADLTNNEDEVITRTPGIDLGISKTGSTEGTFPGLRPGEELSYTVVVKNEGTIDAYGIRVEDMLPPNFIPSTDNFDTFTTAEVTDDTGAALSMLDASGNPVNFVVPITRTGTPAAGATLTWYLGTTASAGATDYYRNLAIPVGGQLTFTLTGTIDENAQDGDRTCNNISVIYEGLPSNTIPEEFLTNNIDSSKVNIWRPDVTINKTVKNEADEDETWTEAGSILVYNLEYNNIGNANADDVCIQEIVPAGTSLVAGSITTPPGGTIAYSPDATNPTSFEICMPVLPAPPNFDAEAAPYDNATDGSGTFDGTDPNSVACADRVPILAEINTDAFPASANSFAVDAGDVDGDGDLDIVMGSATGAEQLWLNDGTGNFTLGYTFPTNRNIQDVSFGDFDGDGSLDVVFAAGNSSGGSYGYMNDGTGNFTPMSTGFVGNQIGVVAVGDFDADGLDDIAIGNWGPARIYTSNGDGSFTAAPSVTGTFRNASAVAADYNNDGYDDLGLQCVGGCGALIAINNQNGTWTNIAIPSSTGHNASIEPGDFNGDGNIDYATGRTIYFGNGAGNMTASQNFNGSTGRNGDAMDIDGDGDLDLIQGSTSSILYLSNTGNGTFSTETVLTSVNSEDAVFGDFDGDGFPDAVVPSNDANGLVLLTNTSAMPYAANSYYETGIKANNITSWDRLLATHTVEEGASISYAIYDLTADDDGDVTNDTPLFGPASLDNGFADISAIPATNDSLILRVDFTSNGVAKACLHNWTATYISPDIPSIEFKVRVDDPVQAGQTTIDNNVTITTTTPEINTDNNDDEDDINIRLTDIVITKSVDKSAVQAPGDETITYTLDWEILGPQSAINVMVYDVLPANVSYQSAVPAPTFAGTTSSGRDSLVWDLGAELNVGASGSIVITSQETSAAAGDNLTNVTWIENDRQETDYDNNNDDVITVVGDFANVYIEKDGSNVVDINGTGQYQLMYGNNGNIPADNVMLSDALPAGFTPTMTDNGACTISGQNINCNFGTLAVGATGTVLVDFAVANDPNLINQTLLNIAQITTTTPETDISDNEDEHEVPVFLLELASIGGTVWHDDNRDGVIDPSENGIDSVMIILTGLDIFGASVQDTAWTDTNGEYSFAGLVPGVYNVEEVQPDGWLTITTTGSDSVTDTGDVIETSNSPQTTRTDEGTVGGGTTNPVNEAYNSITLNGGDRGIEYNFGEDLGIIGDTVWVDNNVNGLQDPSEPPVAGVTVRLYQDLDMDGMLNPALDSLVETTVTNLQGAYLFEDLFADNYFVDFDLTTLPDSLNRVTLQNAGSDDANDSDADPTTGYTELIMLPAGGEDLTWDMGVYGDLLIGNYVWLDSNMDGIQDAGETPLEGVNVTLYTNTGTSLATVQTDANGLYYFTTDTLMNAGLTGANGILAANTEYYIVVGTGGQFDSSSGTLQYGMNNYQLTIDSTGTMENDSDAELASGLGLGFDGLPFTLITTPNFNEADTTFDFGFTTAVYDYGDLPDTGTGTSTANYETSMASNGPSHLIVPSLFLGTLIDDETDGQPDTNAEGDDNNDGTDDEDGLTLPSVMQPGSTQTITITPTNTTGNTAYVRTWIDWNNDGDFDDAGELVVDDNDSSGAFMGSYNINVPSDAATGVDVGVRVRLSNQDGLSSVGASSSGEVEDYLVTMGVLDYDYGDLPDTRPGTGTGDYETSVASNGPSHVIVPGLLLGTLIDSESDGQPTTTAQGDDNQDGSDDEDGLVLPSTMLPGSTQEIRLTAINTTGSTAYVRTWIDWNNDGDFDDPGELVVDDNDGGGAFMGTYTINVPNSAPTGVEVGVRVRLSNQEGLSSVGPSTSGEVEDYLASLGSFDYPDYESPCGDQPCHIVSEDIYLGSGVTSETSATQSSTADSDEDDGLLINANVSFVLGNTINLPVSIYNNTGETAHLSVWIDWNGNGDFEDADEQVADVSYDTATHSGAYIVHLPVNIPSDITQSQPIAVRLRLSTDETAIASPCGTTVCAANGEIEDFLIHVNCQPKLCTPVELNVRRN